MTVSQFRKNQIPLWLPNCWDLNEVVHIMASQAGQDQMHPQTRGYRLLRYNKNDRIFSQVQVVTISSMDGIRYLVY